ncbi:ech hydrogenase subunit A [Paucidesulfovibrio gracilis DSM 16080]|uniref:Ech hydrogenase subunit A n=1 Tax=Paucidesulfovibrio gracilis DSM 16080 TaxID=1121449 RepID=A0A1T4WAD1_9BACT|nr:proton-conducting transporter membrane subunit [Paucidesulfovibrio gracilis]SKA74246.1 ech hydrogenase subunit A [Paucidesulfovibrio gracilis DSM 16080]
MSNLLLILILLPVLSALACFIVRSGSVRRLVVTVTGGVLSAASVALLMQGSFEAWSPGTLFGLSWDLIIAVLDFALLGVILFYGLKLKNLLIQLFTLAQIVLLVIFEFVMVEHAAVPAFRADNLSLIMVLVISIIGSLICIFGLPYMKKHEEHLHLNKSKQPQFFFYLVLFLGAMNGLVLANNILWLYFFFEVTTFCSFMLIGHDGTKVAVANATRALWMNSLGGLGFVVGIMLAYMAYGTLSLAAILAAGPQGALALTGVALLCFAGFTKAAQVPFQSWLLGAMVAPTPVSALLHSSTMVKAGVYVVLRMAPAYQGTLLSELIAVCGAFTFVACAALAIGQSNGKKILAYSTISNLGLIIACAGLNTPLAITAAILLIIFHAISKSLLFLCVGTIEQEIGSRDIEDMRGLYERMPRTSFIAVTGVLTMLLPPFGVLLGKWMAIEAAAGSIWVIIMLALGSALTVVYWARWGGGMMGSRKPGQPSETLPTLINLPLMLLCVGAVVLSALTPVIYAELIQPMLASAALAVDTATGSLGAFTVYGLYAALGLGLIVAFRAGRRAPSLRQVDPYMGGANLGQDGSFKGPMNQPVEFGAGNLYLSELFGEQKLTMWVNIAGAALIVLMIGGGL